LKATDYAGYQCEADFRVSLFSLAPRSITLKGTSAHTDRFQEFRGRFQEFIGRLNELLKRLGEFSKSLKEVSKKNNKATVARRNNPRASRHYLFSL